MADLVHVTALPGAGWAVAGGRQGGAAQCKKGVSAKGCRALGTGRARYVVPPDDDQERHAVLAEPVEGGDFRRESVGHEALVDPPIEGLPPPSALLLRGRRAEHGTQRQPGWGPVLLGTRLAKRGAITTAECVCVDRECKELELLGTRAGAR